MNPEKSVPAQAEKIFALPSKELATQMQINTLLGVFNTVGMFLANATVEDRTGGAIDGGAKTAAEVTMMRTCDRLDTLLGDADRWTIQGNKTLEKALEDAYRENANMLHAQADAFRAAHTPSTQYNPKLFKLPTGAWIAILGDHTTDEGLDKAIVGMGETPRAALDAFNDLFNGKMPENLQEYIAEQQTKLEHEQNQLDAGTNQDPGKNEGRRPKHKRDKQGPGEEPASGAVKS